VNRPTEPPCIVCRKSLRPATLGGAGSNLPSGATVFNASGNYGSTVWDPAGYYEGVLEINVCDECLVERSASVLLVKTDRARTEEPWTVPGTGDQQ
jgi:hypothetical protein